jgi:hypothetical protein
LPLAEEILASHRHRARGDDAGYDAFATLLRRFAADITGPPVAGPQS